MAEQKPLHLLIVDDEQDVTESLCFMLRKLPYDIRSANHAYDALALARQRPVDIMITDIRMPDMDGIELLREVRKVNPDTMVIAISAHGNLDTAVDFMKEGGVDFIQKPVSNEALRLAIRSAEEKWQLRHDLHIANEHVQDANLQLKRNQEQLKENEAKFRLIAENMADVIWIIDTKLQFVYLSPSVQNLFGYLPSELLGRQIYDMLPAGEQRSVGRTLKYHLLAAQRNRFFEQRYELELPKKNGERIWTETLVTVLRNDRGDIVGLQALLRNITARKKVEVDLKAAKEEAESAVKARSEFFANMSHEIRTPMNAVVGLTSILKETSLTQDQRDLVKTVSVSAEALLSIIENILHMSKIESNAMDMEEVLFDLHKCCEAALDIIAPKAAEKKLELIYDIDDSVPLSVVGDEARLRQVLLNLLSNAVKFTHEGEIVLTVRAGDKTETGLRIFFSIKDTGIGISREHREHIFDPFRQADSSTTRKYGGTGLGLAISRHICELMGGELWLQSRLGEGSAFKFYIEVPQLYKKEVFLLPDKRLAEKTILLYLPNETLSATIHSLLRHWGIQVILYKNTSTLQALLDKGGHIDVALIDNVMPDEAITLAQMLKEAGNTSVFFLNDMGIDKNKGSEFVDVWFLKPLKPDQLHERLVHSLFGDAKKTRKSGVRDMESLGLLNCPLRILVAEDNLVNQKVTQRMLENIGFLSDLAVNGQEVLDKIAMQSYDVILMDVQMPVMDGLTATKEIRNQENPVFIIGLSAHAFPEDKAKCLKAGMDDYVTKPVNLERLIEAIRNAQQMVLAKR